MLVLRLSRKTHMLQDLAKYSNLLVVLGTHLSHILEENGVCGGQCLQGSYKAAKL